MINNSIKIIDRNKCFGCRSCELICPEKSIKIVKDEEGFNKTIVDEKKCINCGMCLKGCPAFCFSKKIDLEKQECYAVVAKDSDLLHRSTSGGLFYGLAKRIINDDGIVFGTAYNKGLFVHVIPINSIEQIKLLQGSKYVFSDTENTYFEVKKYLTNDKRVLYSGSPCQIAGLYKYLGNFSDARNLYTVDLICHGTPSWKFFKKYLDYISTKKKSLVVSYEFRNKDVHPLGAIKYQTENGKIYYEKLNLCDPYGYAFASHSNYKMSCYSCPFANLNRVGDITIGDFWGVNQFYPKFPTENGVSVAIVNTRKGEKLFSEIKDEYSVLKVPIVEAVKNNRYLNTPETYSDVRYSFYNDIDNYTAEEFIKRSKCLSHIQFYLKYNKKTLFIKALPKSIVNILISIKNKGK